MRSFEYSEVHAFETCVWFLKVLEHIAVLVILERAVTNGMHNTAVPNLHHRRPCIPARFDYSLRVHPCVIREYRRGRLRRSIVPVCSDARGVSRRCHAPSGRSWVRRDSVRTFQFKRYFMGSSFFDLTNPRIFLSRTRMSVPTAVPLYVCPRFTCNTLALPLHKTTSGTPPARA